LLPAETAKISRMDNRSHRWGLIGVDTDGEAGSARSTRDLISDTSSVTGIMTRKNKLAMVTFVIICTMAVVIGVGYIYLQHTLAIETISRHDLPGEEFEDGDDSPRAEARRAKFVIPDGANLTRYNLSSDGTLFASNISAKPLFWPSDKSASSLLNELIKTPKPIFVYMECPNRQPFQHRANLTIGAGKGVLGYGASKKVARRAAAENAIRYLYDFEFPDIPATNGSVLAQLCGL